MDKALQATIAARIAAATSGNGVVDSAYSMSCRIYVGSLYYDLTANDVSALFESFGDIVKCEMTMDAVTGKSKGFCFIEFRTPEMALAATAMNGFDLAGRKVCLRINAVKVLIDVINATVDQGGTTIPGSCGATEPSDNCQQQWR